jgi:Rrf2 family protein
MEGSLRISEAASLAMHAMAYIASRNGSGPVPVSEVSSSLSVSEAHLGKVLQRLVKHGFLTSRRGPRGGYEMGRKASEVRLLDVYEAVDGPLRQAGCLLEHRACAGSECILGDLVRSVNEQVRVHLTGTRISDLDFDTVRTTGGKDKGSES